jgi:drug/metabolite transporter (DMT)-like permease
MALTWTVMLTATLLALAAAVMHAGWNLLVKQGGDDRFVLLWGQFAIAAVLCIPIVVGFGGVPRIAWTWVCVSGLAHLPYCLLLAKAYNHGDFSVVYPIARGGGAMLAAIGGVLFLADNISIQSALGIGVVVLGLAFLAGPFNDANKVSVLAALGVAGTIGVYSVSDAKGIRASTTVLYALATHIGTAATTTAYGLATGRRDDMRRVIETHWRRLTLAAIASTVTYTLVQLAFKRAPVGYVTALRESSVVLAAFIGWRKLKEPVGPRRIGATLLVVAGMVMVVLFRPA